LLDMDNLQNFFSKNATVFFPACVLVAHLHASKFLTNATAK